MVGIDLTDRTAVITGASSGIGAETASVMASCGARVIAVGRDKDRLQARVQRIRDTGGDATAVIADLRDDDATAGILDAAGERIDILALVAGQFTSAPLTNTSLADLDDLWAVHVRAPFHLLQQSLARLSRAASVLFYSSTVAQVGFAPYAAYTAVKGAVDALARSVSVELAPDVRVNTIAPGFTLTPMVENQYPDAPGLEQAIVARTPAGFLGDPRSAAHMAAFVSSDLGQYIYGARLVVDGGWTAQGWQSG